MILKHKIDLKLKKYGSSLKVYYDNPIDVFREICRKVTVDSVYTNHDYEPYATNRDLGVKEVLQDFGVPFSTFKDQVIFEKNEVIKDNGSPYIVFTPYMRKWKDTLKKNYLVLEHNELSNNFHKHF